jgi:hypothetical protein
MPRFSHWDPGQRVRDFRQAVSPVSDTKRQVFGGFKNCCYSLQKFDSDPERRFAVLIDADPSVEMWLKGSVAVRNSGRFYAKLISL